MTVLWSGVCTGVWLCTCVVRVSKTDTIVFLGFISELWTLWVHAGGRPIYLLLFTLAFTHWLVWQIVFTHSSVQVRDQENYISKRQFVLYTLTDSKFNTHFKWKYFLFVPCKRAWTWTLLSDIHLLILNLKRMFYLWKTNIGKTDTGFQHIQYDNPPQFYM